MKTYSKPSVAKGNWYRVSDIYKTSNDEDLFIGVQNVDSEWQDHYRVFVNGKPVPRVSYFGEMAYHSVIREARDLCHWSTPINDLYSVPAENVKDWR